MRGVAVGFPASASFPGGAGGFGDSRKPRRSARRQPIRCESSSSGTASFGNNSNKKPFQLMLPGLGVAAAATAGLAALAPLLASTEPGIKLVCRVANYVIEPGLHISIHSASFSWTSPQWIKGVIIQDAAADTSSVDERKTFITIDELNLQHGLFNMAVRGKRDVAVDGMIVDPMVAESGLSLLSVAMAHSRLASLPFVLSTSTRAQLEELRSKAASMPYPPVVSPEQAPVMFEVNLDTDRGRAVVQEGTVWLPADVRDFLGGPVCIRGTVGGSNAKQPASTEPIPQMPAVSETAMSRRSISELAADADASMGLLLGSLATAQRLTGMERPSSCKLTAVAVESRNFRMGSVGWLYEDGSFELACPARVTAALSTAPARRVLARITPFLGSVIASEDGGPEETGKVAPSTFMKLQLAPELTENKLMVPSAAYEIKLEPLKLSLERTPLLDNLLWLMEKQQKLYKSDIVPAWLAATQVTVQADGAVRSKRVDMQVAGMHVCTWGKYDPATGVDLSLGLPAPTLGKILHDKGLKLKKLNPDYVFQVDVTGPLHRPMVNWTKASKALIGLGLKLQAESAAKSSPAGAHLFQRILPAASQRLNGWLDELTRAPALQVDLPWLQSDHLDHEDVQHE